MKTRILLGILVLALGLAALAQETKLDAAEILERVRSGWQGDSFHAVLELEITLGGATKRHVLEVWTYSEEHALLRIMEPEIDAGSGYLQIGDELWYYSPAVGASIPLPAIGLTDALFGAGPSLGDLSQGTFSEEFTVSVERAPDGRDDEAGELTDYVLTMIPRPDAPVVYGKLVVTATADYVIREVVYYDQRDAVIRTATFGGTILVGESAFPTEIVIGDASGDQTVERIVDPEFDLEIDETFFTLERLEEIE